jgi:hypothetical protein
MFSLLGKSSGVISLASNPDIDTWYSGLSGEMLPLLVDSLGWRQMEGFFSFFFFLISTFLMGLNTYLQ